MRQYYYVIYSNKKNFWTSKLNIIRHLVLHKKGKKLHELKFIFGHRKINFVDDVQAECINFHIPRVTCAFL